MHRRRTAFTLLEVLLVVAILVAIAAMSMPVWVRMLESQKLRKSGDVLRAELARTRIRAMKSGRIQMFRYQINGGGFIAEPWIAADDGLEANVMQAPGQLVQTSQYTINGGYALEELPEGIQFLGSEILSDERSLEVDSALAMELSREHVWSPPILFYPDGSSSNARIILTNKRQQVVEVTLRGITGISQSSRLQTPQELNAQ